MEKIEILNNFKKSFNDVCRLFCKFGDEGLSYTNEYYPFHQYFPDLTKKVNEWIEHLINGIKPIIPKEKFLKLIDEYNNLKSLVHYLNIKNLTLMQLHEYLNGHNYSEEDGLFDVNLKEGTYTIFQEGQTFKVSDLVECYDDEGEILGVVTL